MYVELSGGRFDVARQYCFAYSGVSRFQVDTLLAPIRLYCLERRRHDLNDAPQIVWRSSWKSSLFYIRYLLCNPFCCVFPHIRGTTADREAEILSFMKPLLLPKPENFFAPNMDPGRALNNANMICKIWEVKRCTWQIGLSKRYPPEVRGYNAPENGYLLRTWANSNKLANPPSSHCISFQEYNEAIRDYTGWKGEMRAWEQMSSIQT